MWVVVDRILVQRVAVGGWIFDLTSYRSARCALCRVVLDAPQHLQPPRCGGFGGLLILDRGVEPIASCLPRYAALVLDAAAGHGEQGVSFRLADLVEAFGPGARAVACRRCHARLARLQLVQGGDG